MASGHAADGVRVGGRLDDGRPFVVGAAIDGDGVLQVVERAPPDATADAVAASDPAAARLLEAQGLNVDGVPEVNRKVLSDLVGRAMSDPDDDDVDKALDRLLRGTVPDDVLGAVLREGAEVVDAAREAAEKDGSTLQAHARTLVERGGDVLDDLRSARRPSADGAPLDPVGDLLSLRAGSLPEGFGEALHDVVEAVAGLRSAGIPETVIHRLVEVRPTDVAMIDELLERVETHADSSVDREAGTLAALGRAKVVETVAEAARPGLREVAERAKGALEEIAAR